MKIYTIHGADSQSWPARFIREGFSWGAFWLGPIWALAHGLRREAAGLVGAWIGAVLIGALISGGAIPVLLVLVQAVFGHLAQDRRRRALHLTGAPELGVISALSEEHAAHLWLERHPELAKSLI
jgi:hypothetical protein